MGFFTGVHRGVYRGIYGLVHPIDEAGSRNGVYDFQLMWACQGRCQTVGFLTIFLFYIFAYGIDGNLPHCTYLVFNKLPWDRSAPFFPSFFFSFFFFIWSVILTSNGKRKDAARTWEWCRDEERETRMAWIPRDGFSYIRRTEIALSSEYPGRSMSSNTATQPTSFSSLFATTDNWVFLV
ncbi:hypothetical protein B0T13DRAFT_148307 [Neurospora crassa]|nr:hypothetical protein B0T13DRAFT_148307 [Neurospora crassa]